jgi:ribosomal protein S27AE
MRNVPRLVCGEQHFCEKPEPGCARFAGAARIDVLRNLRDCISSSEGLVVKPVMEDQAKLLRIDIERRTTRGRACPQCGGKIIPSQRAVYQNTADPTAVFPVWQCERCGYEELSEKPQKPAGKKH